jgi:hypothetical protein
MKLNLLHKPGLREINARWIWAAYIALGIVHVALAILFGGNFIVYEGIWLVATCGLMAIPCRRFYGDWSHLWIIPMVTVASTWLGILSMIAFSGRLDESSFEAIVWALLITVPEILLALGIRWYINWLEY